MKCPIDQSPLQLAERHGIEIDYCSECRGVWLDRGELDKIVARAASDAAPAPTSRPHRDDDRFDDDRFDDDGGARRGGKRRRSSFLGELFDFG